MQCDSVGFHPLPRSAPAVGGTPAAILAMHGRAALIHPACQRSGGLGVGAYFRLPHTHKHARMREQRED